MSTTFVAVLMRSDSDLPVLELTLDVLDRLRIRCGVRITFAHRTAGARPMPICQGLCRCWGGPLVSTSANRANRPPARSALAVRRALGRGLDCVLTGPCGGAARPSSIRDGATGAVLR